MNAVVRHDPLAAHRGPYLFELSRPHPTKPGHATTEWLRGSVRGSADEIRAEAFALLGDPRDTVVSVGLWSEVEQCYVTVYRKGDEARNWSPIVDSYIAELDAVDRNTDEVSDNRRPVALSPATIVDRPAPAPAAVAQPAQRLSGTRSGAATTPAPADRKTCAYSGTKGLAEGAETTCPLCGAVRKTAKENRGHGKFGPVIFPYHKPPQAK